MVNRGSRETAGFPVSGPLHHGVTLRPLANRSCGQTLTANALYVVRYTAARLGVTVLSPNPPKDTDGRREESGRGVRELQGPGQGAAELLSPRPAIRKMQGQPACRAGEPSGQGEEPPPEGLGGGYPLSQTDARGPAGQVVGHRLDGQPGAVGGEAARGEMVQPDAVLEVRV